jgi:hypothetical protein
MKLKCVESIGEEWFVVGKTYDPGVPEKHESLRTSAPILDEGMFMWYTLQYDNKWKIHGYNEFIAVFEEC